MISSGRRASAVRFGNDRIGDVADQFSWYFALAGAEHQVAGGVDPEQVASAVAAGAAAGRRCTGPWSDSGGFQRGGGVAGEFFGAM
jgi:hypothetical protein